MTPATRQALSLPATPTLDRFARVAADIKANAPSDKILDLQEALDELNARLTDFRALKPATAALIFGSDEAWRGCLARLGVTIGRRMSELACLKVEAGLEPNFSLDEIRRPIAAGDKSGLRYTGD